MKLKNLSFNKRKLASLLLAAGICLCKGGSADILSYNAKTTLKDGREIMVYFSYGNKDEDYSYVSFEDKVGYIQNCHINYDYLLLNNDFTEIQHEYPIKVDSICMYQYPDANTSHIGTLYKDNVVYVTAKSNNGWYVVTYNNATGFVEERAFGFDNVKTNENALTISNNEQILYGRVTGNNINVRSSPTTKKDNIIGFCDVTDTFKIIERDNDWYLVEYLGQTGYISAKFVKEVYYDEEDLGVKRIVYLTSETAFYSDTNYSLLTYLPEYQNAFVIGEYNDLYKVRVDGVIGYVKKNNTKRLSETFVLVDLSRQILKVFKNNKEIYRTHIISGRKSLPTHLGAFKIGHKVKGFQLTADNYVDYWMEFDGNIGLHDASWQKDKYYKEVATTAYDNFAEGRGKEYPSDHGSHGCCNLKYEDAATVYKLVSVGDNVLVIGPNNLIKEKLISKKYYLDDYNDNYGEKVLVKRLI